MITLLLEADNSNITALSNICNTSQSHITLAVIDHRIIAGALGPEFFKLYDKGCSADIEDLAIRIPAKVMKTLCTTACTLRIDIDAGIRLLKLVNGGVTLGVSIPLEQDFNLDLIKEVLVNGITSSEPFDISAISELRTLVPFAESGLQCVNGLAYVLGSGFTAYRLINNSLSFIMTKENISEFVKFANAHSGISIFESSIYSVFTSGGHYFGCKQPRVFIQSDYDIYTTSKPIYTVDINLTELCFVMRTIGIPKGENPKCEFDMERFVVHIDLGSRGRYAIAIGNKGIEPITGKSSTFKLLTENLKRVLSGSNLKLDTVSIAVYKSFIAIKTGGSDFLLVRED